jgi:hypothetical protein
MDLVARFHLGVTDYLLGTGDFKSLFITGLRATFYLEQYY